MNEFLRREGNRASPQPTKNVRFLISSLLEAQNRAMMESHGVTHVVNLAGWRSAKLEDQATFLNIAVRDDETEPIGAVLDVVVDFVHGAMAANDEGERFPHDSEGRDCAVLFHCAAGVSRSATAALACLLDARIGGIGTIDEAFQVLAAARPVVDPNPGFRFQLAEWHAAHESCASCGGVVRSDFKQGGACQARFLSGQCTEEGEGVFKLSGGGARFLQRRSHAAGWSLARSALELLHAAPPRGAYGKSGSGVPVSVHLLGDGPGRDVLDASLARASKAFADAISVEEEQHNRGEGAERDGVCSSPSIDLDRWHNWAVTAMEDSIDRFLVSWSIMVEAGPSRASPLLRHLLGEDVHADVRIDVPRIDEILQAMAGIFLARGGVWRDALPAEGCIQKSWLDALHSEK